jgi:hypothetical protein
MQFYLIKTIIRIEVKTQFQTLIFLLFTFEFLLPKDSAFFVNAQTGS